MGQRSGNNNTLSFYSDNQGGESQIEALQIQQNGNIGIGGTFTPDTTLDISGNIKCRNDLIVLEDIQLTGTLITDSDRRIKDNINKLMHCLDNIDHLNGYKYTRNDLEDKDKIHMGVIAQEIEEIYPELVEEKDGIKGVNYTGLTGMFIECIKELKNQNDALKKKYDILENSLEKRFQNLEKLIIK